PGTTPAGGSRGTAGWPRGSTSSPGTRSGTVRLGRLRGGPVRGDRHVREHQVQGVRRSPDHRPAGRHPGRARGGETEAEEEAAVAPPRGVVMAIEETDTIDTIGVDPDRGRVYVTVLDS